jgi:PAS domain S-box-containing protein
MALYKHAADRRLRASERRYATTLASIGDGVIATDAAGRVTFLNPVAEALTGWGAAEAAGRPLGEVFRVADERTGEAVENPAARVLREGAVVGLADVALLLARDGRRVPVDDCAAPIYDDRGEISGAVLVFRNVTERREAAEALRRSEARFKAFMDHSPALAFVKDAASRYVYANRRWEAQFPEPRSDWAGKSDLDFFPPETAACFLASDRRVLESGGPVEAHEAGAAPTGETRHWLTFKFPLPDSPGPVIGGLALDVTEKVRLEEQLRQAQKMEAIGQLAGGVAHDFNNLLTVINGYSQMLAEGLGPDSAWRAVAEEVLRAGERAADLTRQLLAFSRKQMLRPQPLDLNAVLANGERLLRRLLPESVQLVTRLAPGLPRVLVDPGQVEQVMLNLAVNARDAMPGGGRLTISTDVVRLDADRARAHPGLAAGPHVRLAVADTGQGMDAATRARVFEPFFTTKEVGQGTGLGLATVYGIVKQSGGWVGVESERGRGTTFVILLPSAEDGGTAEPLPARDSSLPGGTETLLLVEDDEAVRGLGAMALRQAGYAVLEARHGVAALELLSGYGGPLDLVVTDLVMPQMSGQSLVGLLQRERPGVRVLFVSGYSAASVADLPGVVMSFLQKPFTPASLTAAVREVLDRPAPG